jgi:hypothetical protein
MPKRSRDENSTADGPTEQPPKAATPISTCKFCGKTFTTRGMTRHQQKCAKIQVLDRKPRSYNCGAFSAGVFEHILSFMGNQTLTKLQQITGDQYPNCEPELARLCSKCENDNPVILNGLCRECESKEEGHMPCTTKELARLYYGVKEMDFHFLPCDVRKRYTLFSREMLEKHMITSCGSKMDSVRHLFKKQQRTKRLNATLQRKEEEADGFLNELAPGFADYVKQVGFRKTDKAALEQCSQRFKTLSAALEERGLRLHGDSRLCKDYVTTGHGSLGSVVDAMEEMNFLFMLEMRGTE